jgi:hypothetical protein
MLNVQKTIEKFRDYVIRESKDNLKRGGQYGSYNNTSALSNSLKGEIVTENGFTIVGFKMADYGAYRDQGVKGKTSSNKAPNSPFKFGSGTGRKGGLTEGIKKWVKQKGFQFRSKEEGSKGRFLSYDSTAYLITRSIFHKGIKPSLFFTKPFEAGYKKYIDVDLLKAFGQDIETMVDYNLKDIK